VTDGRDGTEEYRARIETSCGDASPEHVADAIERYRAGELDVHDVDDVIHRYHKAAELGEAIDVAFARWDHSHLHVFEFRDGKRYMLGGREFEPEVIDSTGVTLASLGLDGGTVFEYVFDLGDDWRHRCEVQTIEVDPEEEYGTSPDIPVPIWGWGWIPDQYGRVGDDE
jgi:Plasmid pRiA4b ORF-3-like protein